MKKLMITSLLAVMAQTNAAEFCYERTYTAQDMAKYPTQIVKSIQLKISEPSNDSVTPMTEDGLIPGYTFLLNVKNKEGKTYVYDNVGAALPPRTVPGISRSYSGEGPFGSFDFDLLFKDNIYQLKIVDDLNVIEKNTFCNDGLECVDSKWLRANDKVNNIYRLKEIACDKLTFVKHKNPEVKTDKPKMEQAGLGLSISYKGKMIYSLIKNKKLTAEQRRSLNVPDSVDVIWKRYYQLTQIDMVINGMATGLQPVNPADANAFAFDPNYTDVFAAIFAEAKTWADLVEEVPLKPGDVKWDGKGNLLSADLVGPLRASGFLGSTVGADVDIDGTIMGGSVTINNFKCVADKTLTKLICDVDYATSMNMKTR